MQIPFSTHPFDIPAIYSLWQKPFINQKLVPFIKNNLIIKSSKILELGCGPGSNTNLFHAKNYTGIDLNQSYINQAKKLYPEQNFIIANACKPEDVVLPYFDLIFSNSLFHHLSDEQLLELFSGASNLLSKDGSICIIDMVADTNSYLSKALVSLDRGKHPKTENRLRQIFQIYFSELEFVRYNLKMFGLDLWEMVYLRGSVK